ncbi:MAG: NIPSNAP family containing protein [Microthrixaceae bacterium]
MPRVYIHEVVEVDGTRRAHYQHHMTANWVPEASATRRQRCFGVFTLVGSTGAWPRVVNIWEYDSWADLAHNFAHELDSPGHRDPMLERWWTEAAEFRSGGLDRILVADEHNPGVQHWESRAGTSAVAYAHEVIDVVPGTARGVADAIGRSASEADSDSPHGSLTLVGLWTTAMRADDEVVALWGIPDWRTWAAFEESISAQAARHRGLTSLQRTLLVDAELSPLRIGRQPIAADRRPIEEFG